jgi:hypothetical protein
MIKRFCNACGKEIVENGKKFNPLVHLLDTDLSRQYVDRDFNPVSGREEVFDLCLPCYNCVMGKAVKEFNLIREAAE